MAAPRKPGRAALGFSIHTGWAVLVAVSAESPGSVAVLDRRRVVMIPGSDPGRPPFVYHAARELARDAAEQLVHDAAEQSLAGAKAALRTAIEELASRGHEVAASGIVTGNPPPATSLDVVLRSHSFIHAAEGLLFRETIRRASEALGLVVVEIAARELGARAAAALGIAAGQVPGRLAVIGRAAARPWAKDHKDACLAALVALLAGGRRGRPA